MRRALLAPLAAAALLLAACGGDDAASDTVATTIAPVAAAEHEAASPAMAAEPAPGSDAASGAGDMSMRAMFPVEYVFDGEIPAVEAPAVSWVWRPGASPTTEQIAALAAAFGVEGPVTEQTEEFGGGWVVGDPGAGPRLWVYADAQASWSYTDDVPPVCAVEPGIAADSTSGVAEPATDLATTAAAEPAATDPGVAADGAGSPPDTPVAPPDTVPCVEPVGIPTAAEAEARAVELLQALGLDAAAYEFEANSTEWGAWVDGRLRVDGIPAPVLTSFGFGPEGALQYASGQLAAPATAGTFPRLAAAEALQQLQDDQFGAFGPAIDPALTDAAPADAPVSASPESEIAPVAPAEPVQVVLTDVQPAWWMIWADDGTVWLLPGFDFITEQGERISAPAVAQIDMPVVETMKGEPEIMPGAGEAPAEADLATPLG